MSLLGILFLSTALERKREGMGFGHFYCIEEDLFIRLYSLSGHTVMRTMWLRFSVSSARLFESQRMTGGGKIESKDVVFFSSSLSSTLLPLMKGEL